MDRVPFHAVSSSSCAKRVRAVGRAGKAMQASFWRVRAGGVGREGVRGFTSRLPDKAVSVLTPKAWPSPRLAGSTMSEGSSGVCPPLRSPPNACAPPPPPPPAVLLEQSTREHTRAHRVLRCWWWGHTVEYRTILRMGLTLLSADSQDPQSDAFIRD